MSVFSKALQQADRDHALAKQARRQKAAAVGVAPDGAEAGRAALQPSAVPPEPVPLPRPPLARPSLSPATTADGIDGHLVSLLRPSGFEAEQYRALRHMIEQKHVVDRLSIIAVSSPGVDEGKTTTAINLAGALAQAPGARVLVADADLRRPSLATRFGVNDSHPGLADAVLDPCLSLDALVLRYAAFNLDVLTAGRSEAAPYEIMKSYRLRELLETSRRVYDYIILDTPPVVPVPDCRALCNLVDGILLVVAAHKTSQKMLEESLHLSDPSKVFALVFNADDQPMSGYYGSYYDRSVDGDRVERRGR